MNSMADQIKTVIETSFGVIQPQSRLVACLDERDKRLKSELQSMLDKKMDEIVAAMKQLPKATTDINNEEGIPTDLKKVAEETLNLIDDAQKALDFDKYASQDNASAIDNNPLTPATAALKARMAETPIRQSMGGSS